MKEISFTITNEEIFKANKILSSQLYDYKIIGDIFQDFVNDLPSFLDKKLNEIQEIVDTKKPL